MHGIPPALESDSEDVTWALQTAEALWKRNERADALVWLRRAVRAAGDAEDDDRALALANGAAELAEWMADQESGAEIADVSDIADDAELIEGEGDGADARVTQTDEVEEVTIDVALEFEPKGDARAARAFVEAAQVTPVAPPSAPPPPRRMPSPPPLPSAAEKQAGRLDPWADSQAPLPGEPEQEAPTWAQAGSRVLDVDEVVTSAPPIPAVVRAKAAPALDLSQVEALSDLPDDARDAFARAGRLREISRSEEISGFALALIVQGSVYLAATIVDAPAQRLEAGAVLRSRGTLEAPCPLRLVAATEKASVAVWGEADVEAAFGTCPWVEDELRAAGDRFQALVGLTLGPLGERLDFSLRAHVAGHLTLRALSAGEAIVSRGKPVPGLVVVGAGELELTEGDGAASVERLRPGDFLFPSEVLRAAPAPRTARAARSGALVLCAERRVAQELMMTCPPLLEIFAG